MAPEIYAFERRVRSVIFFDHPAQNFGDEGIEINAKMEMYTTMTAFQWFPPSNKDPFPNVNGLLLSQKKTLLDQASKFRQSFQQSPSLLSFLNPQHQTVIQRQIYILLYSSPKIRRATSKLQGGESNHWDTLLFCFYIDNQEILSPTVLLEPTIHYSRNIFADETDPAQLAALVKEEIESNMKFCGQAELAAMAHGHSTSWRDEASSAHDRAFRLMCSYVDYLRTTDGQQPLHHLIQDRSRHEAKEGTCGAICCLMVPLPPFVRLADISAFQFITRVRDGITRGAIEVQGSLTTGKDEDSETRFKEEVTEQGRVRDSERNLLGRDTKPKSITTLCHSGSGATAQPIIPEFEPSVFDDKLLFPHLLVQNKKTDETETTAISQGRVRLLSMISFYAALGIVDRPFYALITNGPEGTVLMGWQSKRVKRTYLFEKNVVKFNIGTALGAYHFAIFLLRLREEQTDLAKLIESKLTGRHFNFEQLLSWRKESQVPR